MAKTDSILVWFGKSENDQNLKKRIKERCEFISESAFMKEAAKEKLDLEDAMKNINYKLKPEIKSSKDEL